MLSSRRAQPATRTYTVRLGDTLSSIAESYYNNPGDWQVDLRREQVQDQQSEQPLRR